MVAPVPMEDIERMAALCMKDLDEDGDDDADLEDDADLLVTRELRTMQYAGVQMGTLSLKPLLGWACQDSFHSLRQLLFIR